MVGIIPNKESHGTDICATNDAYYIVRSDVNCYMKSTNFNQGCDLEVYSLHRSCRGGDHYLAHDGLFYIINGTYYCTVSNMSTGSGAVVYNLHPNCQGGDNYLSAFGKYYIIFQERGTYRSVANLNTDEDATERTLHPDCKDGLYYWGVKDYCYFVTGIEYYRCTNLHQNLDGGFFSIHNDVTNFLPGGISITKGPAYGTWECIKTLSDDAESPFVWDCIKTMSNDSESPIIWAQKITRKVGYTRAKMSSIECNWNVSLGASYNSGDLAAAFVKMQFSMSGRHGGKSVNTESENWSEATEVEESLSITLKRDEKMYIWQYKLGLGMEDILYCRNMKFNSDSLPPFETPLPPA